MRRPTWSVLSTRSNPVSAALIGLALCITLVASICLVTPARSHPGPNEHVDAALHYAAAEWNVSYDKMKSVSYCESTWNPNASNGGNYIGLFQHKATSWSGRVKLFNDHVRLHNSRHPHQQLPEMLGHWNAPIDASRVTAAMVAGVLPGYNTGWGPWSCA